MFRFRVPRGVGRAFAVVLVCMAVVGAVGVGSAAAQVITGAPHGIVPHERGKGTRISHGLPYPQPPLLYWGGPVLRTNQSFAIFWDPAGAFPAGYEGVIERFLQDVAADSGKTSNVYSVLNQYYDTTGSIAYDSTFAG